MLCQFEYESCNLDVNPCWLFWLVVDLSSIDMFGDYNAYLAFVPITPQLAQGTGLPTSGGALLCISSPSMSLALPDILLSSLQHIWLATL